MYRLETFDGLEHLLEVRGEEDGNLLLETIHRLGHLEYRTQGTLNRCLFEELINLGVLRPVESP